MLDDVRRSVLMKSEEIGALRVQTLSEGREALVGAASGLRKSFQAGGKLLALGNGGSATDAMDIVADSGQLPPGRGERRSNLTEDPAILTAIDATKNRKFPHSGRSSCCQLAGQGRCSVWISSISAPVVALVANRYERESLLVSGSR